MKKKIIFFVILLLTLDIVFISLITTSYASLNKSDKTSDIISKKTTSTITTTKIEVKPNYKIISMNAIGDCTIGYDDNFGYTNSFNQTLENNDYAYFFSNVKDILDKDDLTIANFEGTFTEATEKVEKAFNFKAPLDYVNVLTAGSIETVNIANNHTYDYSEIGYNNTIETLTKSNINYYGYDNYYIYEKEGIKIGFAGIYCIENRNCTSNVDKSIKYLKEQNVDSIVISFHWGIEKSYKQSEIQTYLAHYAIDNGVDLILGHHPHVLQGIELYKNKYIVYSLANFVFGGNKNPSDKDSMIFNIYFKYNEKTIEETIVNVYPVSVSSVQNKNDYKPTLLTGTEYERVINKIQQNSIGVDLT